MPAPIYKFSLDSFQILDTRARHHDTDYVTFSLQVGTGKPHTQTKFMGDLGNGVYPVNLFFDGVSVGSNDPVVLTYMITNSGAKSQSDATSAVEAAAEKLVSVGVAAALAAIAAGDGEGISAAVGTAIGALAGGGPGSIIGAAVGALAGFLLGELIKIINADCDGVVAVEVFPLLGIELWKQTGKGEIAKSTDQVLAGSPAGCNTSHYIVKYAIDRSVRTTVSAISDAAGQRHLFAVGQDSHVYHAYTTPGTWHTPGYVSTGLFPYWTPVASLLDGGERRMHLFAVHGDGRVWTASAVPGEDWSPWAAVASGTFQQRTTISALYDSIGTRKRMRLFAVGEDGRVFTTSAEPAGEWGEWTHILNGVFTLGTTVSSVTDKAGKIHLFAVGQDGRVYTASAEPAKGGLAGPDQWTGWYNVLNSVFSQGTTVTALLDSAGAVRLFAVEEHGQVFEAASKPGQAWEGWSLVSSGVFYQGTTIAALSDKGGRIHLFAVGEDGRVYTAWAAPDQPWQGWNNVSNGVFKQGTILSTLVDNSGLMNLFAVGEDGRVYTAWSDPDKEWQGWSTEFDWVLP